MIHKLTQKFCSHCGGYASVAVEVASGLQSFVRAVAGVTCSPAALKKCIGYTPLVLACVAVSAGLLWLGAMPLRWSGLLVLDWRDALRASSLLALAWLRFLLPSVSSSVFFAVLRERDAAIHEEVSGLPIIHGLRDRAFQWLKLLLGLLVLAVLAGISAPTVLPLLAAAAVPVAAAVGALISTWWLLLPILLLVAVGTLGGRAYVVMAPFLAAWQLDPILALMAFVLAMVGCLHAASFSSLLKTALVMYCSCTLLTQELLSQYAQRLDSKSWAKFKRRHCWRLFGFGLPLWALIEYMPVAAVALLQVFHGAAGSFLVDLLGHQDGRLS
ncbi:unnamed protein product [Polarella glacialis]|uniref:Uncharacterized protein n=1 Tax=Polarella glacialis TaxID=89957 RepID=A0A813GLL9_POLGL|nr:unnamed protein product [Polarella glacialis]CAE8661456.1 unnamed protein product [Polarella glacialis]